MESGHRCRSMTRLVSAGACLLLLSCGDDVLSGDDTALERYQQLAFHDGYWVSDGAVTVINDMHIDVESRSATVYARALIGERIFSPPQVGPGECDATGCFHPNAIYLNGQGEERTRSDGTGGWWVKHAWIVDGADYLNCELPPQQQLSYQGCFPIRGVLQDDGLGIELGHPDGEGPWYNVRTPLLDETTITYTVTRYVPGNPEPVTVLNLRCVEAASPLDDRIRPCPRRES